MPVEKKTGCYFWGLVHSCNLVNVKSTKIVLWVCLHNSPYRHTPLYFAWKNAITDHHVWVEGELPHELVLHGIPVYGGHDGVVEGGQAKEEPKPVLVSGDVHVRGGRGAGGVVDAGKIKIRPINNHFLLELVLHQG